MKVKSLLLLPVAAVFIYLGLSSYAGGPGVSSIDGTGAQGGSGCSTGGTCHGSSSSTTTIAIELDSAGVSVSHYIAGQSYTIKVTGTNTSSTSLPRFGFQVTAVKLTGAGTSSASNAGTLATSGLLSRAFM